jgi:hypothetical protein
MPTVTDMLATFAQDRRVATGPRPKDAQGTLPPAVVPAALRLSKACAVQHSMSTTILADHEWPRLYDAEVLAEVDVPCAAVIYADDPYMIRRFSEETADLLPGMRRWLTDEYVHNGPRVGGRD